MTSDLWRFPVDPVTVGLGSGLQPELSLPMLPVRVWSVPQREQAEAKRFLRWANRNALLGLVWNRFSLPQVLNGDVGDLWSLVWLTNSTDRILANFQKLVLILYLWFQRRHDAFFILHPFFILCPDYWKNTQNSYLSLLVLASHSPEQLWYLYLPFSRKPESQLNNLYSIFIYYQSALSMVSTQDEGRDVHPGTSGQGFYGWYNPVADPDLWRRTGLWWANYSSQHIFQLLLSGRSF